MNPKPIWTLVFYPSRHTNKIIQKADSFFVGVHGSHSVDKYEKLFLNYPKRWIIKFIHYELSYEELASMGCFMLTDRRVLAEWATTPKKRV